MKARQAGAEHVALGRDTERAISELLAPLVGHYPFQDVVAFVRETLVHRALVVAQGNKTNAARLLGVTRQAIQQHAPRVPSLFDRGE